jgi:hypothetical protein
MSAAERGREPGSSDENDDVDRGVLVLAGPTRAAVGIN